MPEAENVRKIRLELLDGTVEVTGTEDFLRKAQALFVRLASNAPVDETPTPPDLAILTPPPDITQPITDIRSLREQKHPRNQIEMAALVAHYVTHLLPPTERKETINSQDITKYFGQAGYQMTSQPRYVLFNAKNAGYIDSASAGEFKLNPVGYNLVTAGLPPDGTAVSRRRPSYGRRKQRKARAKKKK